MDGRDAEELVKNADLAMYKAKQKGKNQFVLCSPLMKANIEESLAIANKLYGALERNELELYYQPQISCVTNKIIGVEALLRWSNPELGITPPSKFIPIAEQTGLILPIGEWVMRQACIHGKRWRELPADITAKTDSKCNYDRFIKTRDDRIIRNGI
ncbi:GGDEF domain-containing phosphodiesterase [Clostridium estertheticum]|uniref:GGDEF domain-containing phosphodiesterase n=2 Tax=Clostridium estertheticum TaxID=238834 RepID=UPI0028167BC2|nr:GGDEF domain-containing phosphodiesterase [Clostridium estertheticum]